MGAITSFSFDFALSNVTKKMIILHAAVKLVCPSPSYFVERIALSGASAEWVPRGSYKFDLTTAEWCLSSGKINLVGYNRAPFAGSSFAGSAVKQFQCKVS